MNPTMHHSHIPWCTTLLQKCSHFCYKMVHYGIVVWCIVGFMRWIHCNDRSTSNRHTVAPLKCGQFSLYNTHQRDPIARLWGWDMGCLFMISMSDIQQGSLLPSMQHIIILYHILFTTVPIYINNILCKKIMQGVLVFQWNLIKGN